ncbi:DHA2 family efflux MFS transporter permease subunit [Cohnella lubricantis]|uniref:DHA2 family efflux MFS transporter permease subunit n=1 Tax=Cohnella lubricantis TaxID=2163172 RepID=A0A841TI65_9BACL|nr:DHA2 family efflux MFS transporter permease subunit [Cohnella lubricantis]MBB6678637.1 DHA2 family efflux MFS transporter permease subunit [Cohnella lubricantis]MBP2119203.1 EmrB/QacA subfamily drug resistance transporter [Cohnella lubricantis]
MSSEAKQDQAASSSSIGAILAPLVAIIVGIFMVILDGTAVNVAIPKLQEEFVSSLSLIQWTVTGYALAQAAVIPLAGWLSDRFGAKRIFLISIALFTIGSGLCALADSAEMLILFRILQGLGGGVVMPISMAFVYRIAPKDKVGAVMGMMGIPILLAPALGPVLAGWMVDYVSWHWIFLINLPIGIIAVILGIRTLPNIERQTVAALDLLGIILAPLAFAALSYGVTQGGTSWTSTETLVGICVGAVALILFIFVELRRKNPLLELRVFRSGNFTRGIIVQWVSQFALFGSFFLVPLFLQQAHGYSAFETGLIMLPQAIASGLFMPIGGKLSDRFGARPMVLSGMVLVIAAALLLSNMNAGDGIVMVMLPLALLGAGMGLFMMPLNTHLIQSAPQNLVGRVTSLTNAAQQVMSSLAIATLTTVSGNKMKDLLTDAQKPVPGIEEWTSTFNYTFFILMFIAIAGLILGLLLRKPKIDPNAEPAAEAHMVVG